MIRSQVAELVNLGPFPASKYTDRRTIEKQDELMRRIERPVSDEEARERVKLFGPDDYFGLAWTVLHLVETAPGWPLPDCLEKVDNEWIQTLRQRRENAQRYQSGK